MKKEGMPMADFHQDTLNPKLSEILDNPKFDYSKERIQQLPKEGLQKLDIVFSSVYKRMSEEEKAAALSGNEEVLSKLRTDEQKILDYYHASEDFKIITRPEDLQGEQPADQNSIVLHKEGGDIISDPDIIDDLYNRGVRSVGLMYNHDNQLGGGASGDKKRGLTVLGKRVVDKMMQSNMIIDISHANRKTADDILERVGDYEKTVATHTAPGEGQRFITKELIRKIAGKGGVVGFTPNKAFFPDFEKFMNNFKEVSDATGSVKNIAVGTDFGGVDAEQLFHQLDEIGKLSRIAEKLSEEGKFSDEEINDIMYGNIARIVNKL
ncbi:MAG: dipeptidase [Candidatus Kerfeldbacteria bacterium]